MTKTEWKTMKELLDSITQTIDMDAVSPRLGEAILAAHAILEEVQDEGFEDYSS